MNANEVLVDILEDNRRRLLRALDGMSDECVKWKPESGANNIGSPCGIWGGFWMSFLPCRPGAVDQQRNVGFGKVGPNNPVMIHAVSVKMAGACLLATRKKKLQPCRN